MLVALDPPPDNGYSPPGPAGSYPAGPALSRTTDGRFRRSFMDSLWLVAYLVLSGTALLLSVLLAVQTWEHRRYARSCMRGRDRHWPTGRAAVLVPCKGVDVDLDGNLAALFRQDYRDFELVFVVEDRDDPARAVIDRLIAGHPDVPARLIVAGHSSRSGQKVHNLRAAAAAWAATCNTWRSSIPTPPRAPSGCGCSWPVWTGPKSARRPATAGSSPCGRRWPTICFYSMNCGVMMLLGLRGQHWVWGGSWAIRRERFDALGLADAWKGTVSDDLMASRLLGEARLPTRFEPVAVVGSPLDLSFGQMFAFLRRQYLLGRHHVGFWWATALAGCTVTSLAWLASAAAIGWSLLGSGWPLWIPLGAAAVLYAVGVFRGARAAVVGEDLFPRTRSGASAARNASTSGPDRWRRWSTGWACSVRPSAGASAGAAWSIACCTADASRSNGASRRRPVRTTTTPVRPRSFPSKTTFGRERRPADRQRPCTSSPGMLARSAPPQPGGRDRRATPRRARVRLPAVQVPRSAFRRRRLRGSSGWPPCWCNSATTSRTVQLRIVYAKFLHEHSLDHKAYGFCDDDANQAAFFSGKGSQLVVTLGWD